MIKKLLLCLSALVVTLCLAKDIYASKEWNVEDTQEYYKGLSLEKQKAFNKNLLK